VLGRREERCFQTFDKLEGSSRQQELSLIFPQVYAERGEGGCMLFCTHPTVE
jgi:hypothetical protein